MPKVVLQDLSSGDTRLVDAPAPSAGRHDLVIANRASLVSAGTERMLVDFGRASLVGKVRSQPQRVAEVIDKARTDGVATTVDAIRSKLAQPIPLGYSCAGVVVEVGSEVQGIEVGDVVAAAGPHAEVTVVPVTLAALVPDGVAPADAAFATVGSIALQGLRLAAPTVGERFVVIGLGLVGLLAVQLLSAQGCAVLGIDPNPTRRARAEAHGAVTVGSADDVLGAAANHSRGRGVDGVLICASTTSNEPVHQAAQMCRKRGRIVLVGVTGLELDRADFYEKELTFQVSAAYGPGRYDADYEAGHDYPLGHVRWTAGRNMEAVLDLIAAGRVDPSSLVTHEYEFAEAPAAYETLVGDPSALGIVLRYPDDPAVATRRTVEVSGTSARPTGRAIVGMLGAGNFASQVLIPAVAAAGGSLDTIVSSQGTTASIAAGRFGAARASTDPESVFASETIDTVIVATRHDSHADYVERALRAGKHVFVEKPLAIDRRSLERVVGVVDELAAAGDPVPLVGIGFNRRFAPVTVRMSELLAGVSAPRAIVATMNAGALPADHWTQDPAIGGGRIVGEACHMIDLVRHLVGAPIIDVVATGLDAAGPRDTVTMTMRFADGSIGTVNYFSNGSKQFPKERVEVFAGGRVLVNENFRTLRAYGFPGVRTMRLHKMDKGHAASMKAFLDAVRSEEPAPIPFDEIVEVSRAALDAAGLT